MSLSHHLSTSVTWSEVNLRTKVTNKAKGHAGNSKGGKKVCWKQENS